MLIFIPRNYTLFMQSLCRVFHDLKQKQMSIIGKLRKELYDCTFPKNESSFITINKYLPYMKDTLSDFMVHSVALVNSSHYDVNDDRSS